MSKAGEIKDWMRRKWRFAFFEIACTNASGKRMEEGSVRPPFAVYYNGEHWSLTHIPTGYAVVLCESKEHAQRIAREIVRRTGLTPWDFVEPDDKDALQRVRPISREVIRSVYPDYRFRNGP